MNQKRNYPDRADSGLFRRPSTTLLSTSLWLLFVLTVTPNNSFAQGNFGPSQVNGLNDGQWAPPSSPQSGVYVASGQQPPPSLPAGLSFPKTAVAFDPGVRMAHLEVPEPNQTPGDRSLESTVDTTATMLSNLKTATSRKISGLAANFQQDGGWMEKAKSLLGTADTSRMLGSLTLVLGVYFAFVWVMRKINPGGNAGLPPEVIEVMGEVPFGPKRNLQLVRLGSKLLLLMNSPEGTQPIGEITDPIEVEYLASLCPGKRKSGSRSVAAIQQAAARLANTRSTPSARPDPTPQSAPSQGPTTHSNLARILRALDQATQQNSAIFEA